MNRMNTKGHEVHHRRTHHLAPRVHHDDAWNVHEVTRHSERDGMLEAAGREIDRILAEQRREAAPVIGRHALRAGEIPPLKIETQSNDPDAPKRDRVKLRAPIDKES